MADVIVDNKDIKKIDGTDSGSTRYTASLTNTNGVNYEEDDDDDEDDEDDDDDEEGANRDEDDDDEDMNDESDDAQERGAGSSGRRAAIMRNLG